MLLLKKKAFDNIIKLLDISSDDKFIDIGCGKGATLYYATNYPFSRIAGIEIEQSLFSIAKNNFLKLNISNVELFNENAISFDKYDEFNVFFLFNPFSSDIYKKVFDKVTMSVANKEKVYLICYGDSPTEYIRNDGRWTLLHDYIDKVRETNVHIWLKNENK